MQEHMCTHMHRLKLHTFPQTGVNKSDDITTQNLESRGKHWFVYKLVMLLANVL